MSHDKPLYGLDIETDTSVSESERAAGITQKGLDPVFAGVTDIAISGIGWEKVFTGPEREIFVEFERFLKGLVPGVLVTWNGAAFDLPFLKERYRRLGVEESLRLEYDPSLEVKYEPLPGHPGAYRGSWGAHEHADISHPYKAVAERLGVKHSLKPVYVAVTGERPIEVDRENMHLLSDADRVAYGASDVRITRDLALRLPAEVIAAAQRQRS